MKIRTILFSLIALVVFPIFIQAQECEIPNGDFEIWIDETELAEEDDLPEGTIMLPEGYFGFIRLLLYALDDVLGSLFGEELIDFAGNLFGMQQSTDASSGDFALQVGGDSFAPFADVLTAFECNGEVPETYSFDIKHVGTCVDTLISIVTFDEFPVLPDSEDQYPSLAAYVDTGELYYSTDTEYETVNVPIINNDNGVPADSVFLLIFALGNQACLEAGNESYFLIDNMQFNTGSVVALDLGVFSATSELDHNRLEWKDYESTTGGEYAIMRSINNNDNFEKIATVLDEQEEVLQYLDYDLKEAGPYYYQLVHHDVDGNMAESEIIMVEVEAEKVAKITIQINPNPVQSDLFVDLYFPASANAFDVKIYSALGELIYVEKQVQISTLNGYMKWHLPASEMTKGEYILDITSQGISGKQKFVVVN